MKLNYIFLSIIVSTSLFFTGCFNNGSTPVYRDAEGVVLEGGTGVANADIHIRNNFDPGGFTQQPSAQNYTIEFGVQTKALYSISLFRHGADTLFNTFFEDTLASGQHAITVPDSLLTNGILGYEVRADQDILISSLFLVNKPDSLLSGSLPFTTTNALGEFTLNADYLALGESFTSQTGGFEVTDSLKIYVVQDSSIQTTRAVKIKPNQDNFFEIILD